MDADTLATYDDPAQCLNAIVGVGPSFTNELYFKLPDPNPLRLTGTELRRKELNLAREAITHAKCYKRLHTHITTPIRLQRDAKGVLVFLSERVVGMTLLDAVKEHPSRTHDLVGKTLQIIALMVQHGIRHRDLHGANVMVTSDFDVKIIDFGFAMIADELVHGVESTPLFPTNKSPSQDTCILMRSIALHLDDPYHPYIDMYDIIMRRYERECSDRLPYLPKPAYWTDVPTCVNKRHRDALEQLYLLNNKVSDSALLDYYLGAFEWKTMTPEAILKVKKAILRERGINVQESKK